MGSGREKREFDLICSPSGLVAGNVYLAVDQTCGGWEEEASAMCGVVRVIYFLFLEQNK